MYEKYYLYITNEYLQDIDMQLQALYEHWKAASRRGEQVMLSKVRDFTGGVFFDVLYVKLVGWGVDSNNNMLLLTAGGQIIIVQEKF